MIIGVYSYKLLLATCSVSFSTAKERYIKVEILKRVGLVAEIEGMLYGSVIQTFLGHGTLFSLKKSRGIPPAESVKNETL